MFTVPTDAPEADGTLKWSSAMLVLAEVAHLVALKAVRMAWRRSSIEWLSVMSLPV